MKVVHIIGRFTTGGAEIFLKDLACELNHLKDVKLEVWALSKSNNKNFEQKYISKLQENDIKVKVFDKRHKKDKIKTIIKLRKEIRKSNPSIINCHLEEVTFFTCIANLFTGIPIVQTIHNCKISLPKIQKLFLRYIIDKYIAISESVKSILIEEIKIKESQIEVIFNGIKISKFENNSRKIDGKVFNIVSVGRLTEQKNHELLIKAFAKLIKQNDIKDIPKLSIYGDGELKDRLAKTIFEHKVENYIELKGISNNISDILKSSDIYIMSSLWEGLSISLIEASISGIPIIATNVGSNHEIILDGVNGYLINCNEEELIKAIKKMFDINTRKYFNEMSYINKKKFDIKNTAKEYYAAYSRLIK